MTGCSSIAQEYLERKERVAALFSAGASVGADCVTRPQLYARYALWSHVESLPEPGQGCRGAMSSHGGQGISEVAVRYARALAAASRARDPTRRAEDRDNALATAVSERRRLEEAASAMPPDRQTVPGQGLGIYSAKNGDIAAVLGGVAEAAVLLAEGGDGALEAAERALRAAVAIEDAMGYFEPPSMHQPARQCLGAVLLARGAWEGAEEVFGEDLATFPENAWSLMGMALAKEGLGEGDAGALLRERAAVAWRGESVGAVLSPCPCLGP